jgi:tetratricopeptide (TPR) repeat protein
MDETKDELLDRYEATGDEEAFEAARLLYEQALELAPDAWLLIRYGYLLECHGRNSLRRAVEQFERAIDLDPSLDKAHLQLIGARAGLGEPEVSVARYERRLASAPADLREHRFMAYAYLSARQDVEARSVIDAGVKMAPNDPMLIEPRGDMRSHLGDPEGALADWRQAHVLDSENLSSVYSSAFLLEREGRLDEAIEAWQYIIDWCGSRGYELDIEWPERELVRLREAASASV